MSRRRKHQFDFKQFSIQQQSTAMKVGTDSVVLGAWAAVEGASSILDIGTGTGLLALMVAQRNTTAAIDAVEIEKSAYLEATENFSHSAWSSRIKVHHQSIQEFAATNKQKYDHIISNPPYFGAGTQSPEAIRHHARHADVLPHEDLVKVLSELLQPHGKASLVLPIGEGKNFIHTAHKYKLFVNRNMTFIPKATKDPERMFIELGHNNSRTQETVLIQYDEGGEWSDDYKKLTQDFYLKL